MAEPIKLSGPDLSEEGMPLGELAEDVPAVGHFDGAHGPLQERAAHAGEALEVGNDGAHQLVQQGIEGGRRLGLDQERLKVLEIALEVGRELDGRLGRHGAGGPLP